MQLKLFLITLIFSSLAHGAGTRSVDADVIKTADHTKTFTVPSATGTLIGSANFIQEAPSGTVNGSNVTFTLANTPIASATVQLYLDGLILTQGAGKNYTISSGTITMASAPAAGQSFWAIYIKN